jgi:two-component system response regulator FixJ
VNLKDITVAIVDDDEGVRKSLGFILELDGFKAHQFESSAAFLAMIGGKSIDCLIVDLCMPESTGLVLTAQLREIGIQIPVILMTAHFDPKIEAEAQKLGIYKVMHKPFSGNPWPELIPAAIAAPRH